MDKPHQLLTKDDGLFVRLTDERGRVAVIRLLEHAPTAAASCTLMAKDDGLYVHVDGRDASIRLQSNAPIASAIIEDLWTSLRASSRP